MYNIYDNYVCINYLLLKIRIILGECKNQSN